GAAGIRTDLQMSVPGGISQVAQVRVLLSDLGPSVALEVQRPPVANPQLRVALEPRSGVGTVLVVPEEHIVEGGDLARVSYTQVLAGATQSMLVPGGNGQILVTGPGAITQGQSAVQAQFPRVDSNFLAAAMTRLRIIPATPDHSLRGAIFFGDEAVQSGFKHALEQELGNSYDVVTTGSAGKTDAASRQQGSLEAGWIGNDSGQPLLMVTGANGWQIRIPREKYSASETPLPLVFKSSLPPGSIDGLEPLVQQRQEPLAEVTFESAQGLAPDLLAVVPIGSYREERKLLIKASPAEGMTPIARGVLAVTRWPARMNLPQGVFEAFYMARGRGILCRVPFDVSRQRIDRGMPPVTCSPGWRGVAAAAGQKPMRLAELDAVKSASWLPPNFFTVQNRALGLDFKLAPAPSPATQEIFRRMNDLDFDPPESLGPAPAAGPRFLVYPCGMGQGVMASIRSMRVAARDAVQVFPFHSCDGAYADEQALAMAEDARRSGARVALLPSTFSSMLDEREPLLDRIFPWETLATGTGGDQVHPLSIGRAGTFVEVTSSRRIDGDRIEATLKVGRMTRGLRYVDTPWVPRRIVALSGGKVLGEWVLEAARSDYKVIFRVASTEAGKQTRLPVRFVVTGRMDGMVAYLLQASGDFPVATTQFMDVP
ncbi:MAG: hypothetical protein RIQ81_558, partial [Pseudomonadota bacterium]